MKNLAHFQVKDAKIAPTHELKWQIFTEVQNKTKVLFSPLDIFGKVISWESFFFNDQICSGSILQNICDIRPFLRSIRGFYFSLGKPRRWEIYALGYYNEHHWVAPVWAFRGLFEKGLFYSNVFKIQNEEDLIFQKLILIHSKGKYSFLKLLFYEG